MDFEQAGCYTRDTTAALRVGVNHYGLPGSIAMKKKTSGVPDAASAIRKILRDHPDGLTVTARREIGALVDAHLADHKGRHGTDAVGRLAKDVGRSADTLRHARRFAEYCSEAEAKELEADSIPWRFVLALVPLVKRIKELKQSADLPRRERKSSIAKIERAKRRFLKTAADRDKTLRAFEDDVRQWRRDSMDLWGQGAVGSMLRDCRRRALGGIDRALAALEEMEQLGAREEATRAQSALEKAKGLVAGA